MIMKNAWIDDVHKAMARLNEDQRLAVGLVLAEGLPYKEAAEVLGIPIGTLTSRLARGRVATVAVKEFVFKQPVHIGDLLSFYVDVERIGTTSVTVTVEVYAERRPSDPKVVKVTEATLTYVAIDRAGRPRSVPKN